MLYSLIHIAIFAGLHATGCSAHVSSFNPIFGRACKTCPGGTPACPVCPKGEVCSLSPQSCEECAKTECISLSGTIPTSSNTGTAPKPASTPIGGIVGGVLGAVIVVGLLGFLLFRWHKKKRDAMLDIAVPWQPEKSEEQLAQFGQNRDARASTHTVASIASTVLTRASNVIQIAYIPGITNRSNPNSPSHMIPPVPPLPGGASPYQHNGDQQFFSAEDILRQSMWSTNTDARSSVATTIYRNNAVISPVAATAIRAKAAVVTVKNSPNPLSSAASSINDTPPVPQIDLSRLPSTASQLQRLDSSNLQKTIEPGPLSPAFSVGSTFLNKSNSTAKRQEQQQPQKSKPSSALYLMPNNQRLSRMSTASSVNSEVEGPFTDRASIDQQGWTTRPTEVDSAGRSSPATFQDGDIRMSFRPMSGFEDPQTPVQERGKSPFGDENRLR